MRLTHATTLTCACAPCTSSVAISARGMANHCPRSMRAHHGPNTPPATRATQPTPAASRKAGAPPIAANRRLPAGSWKPQNPIRFFILTYFPCHGAKFRKSGTMEQIHGLAGAWINRVVRYRHIQHKQTDSQRHIHSPTRSTTERSVRMSGVLLIGRFLKTRTPSASGSGCIQVSAQVRLSISKVTA